MQTIALIIPTLQGGGAERCAADLSVLFSKRGFRVYLFTDLSTKVEYEYAGALVNYNFAVSPCSQAERGNLLRYRVTELRRLKEQYHIDIAVSFMQLANYYNILSKGREKVILTTHSVNSVYAKYDRSVFWSDETFCKLYQYADAITFPSEFCRADWLTHYGDANNITRTVYNPVHAMPVKSSAKKGNTVIAVGRMQAIKRQWHLIKAFSLVKKMVPDSRLVLLGDGELRPKLEALVKQYHLENTVEMPGNVNHVADYMAEAKVFAMTSRCEAMPCSVLEALSAGVPVVSCDSPGGIREALGFSPEKQSITVPLRGSCGIITPYIRENGDGKVSGEEKTLAEEIVHLLTDEKLRSRMSENAKETVQRFSPDTVGSVWVDEIFRQDPNREADQKKFETCREEALSSCPKEKALNIGMYVSYYRLLEKWMVLHEKGGSAKQYFLTHGIKRIIVYGLGKMAKHLLEDVKDSGIHVVCAIDVSAIYRYEEIPVFTVEEPLPDADCIVITPVHEFLSIAQELEAQTSIPLISLSEIIDECLK